RCGWRTEDGSDVREAFVSSIRSRRDHELRLEFDDCLRPRLRRILIQRHAPCPRHVPTDVDLAEHQRLDVAEPTRERQTFEGDRIVVDETEDHDATRPSSRSTRAASAPLPRICTCDSCSGGTTSRTVSSLLARVSGAIRSIVAFFARRRPWIEAFRGRLIPSLTDTTAGSGSSKISQPTPA